MLLGVFLVVTSYLLPLLAALGTDANVGGDWRLGYFGKVAEQVRKRNRNPVVFSNPLHGSGGLTRRALASSLLLPSFRAASCGMES